MSSAVTSCSGPFNWGWNVLIASSVWPRSGYENGPRIFVAKELASPQPTWTALARCVHWSYMQGKGGPIDDRLWTNFAFDHCRWDLITGRTLDRAGTTLLKLIYLSRQFTPLKTLRFLWLIFIQTIYLTQLQVGRPCLFEPYGYFDMFAVSLVKLNSIQMMSGGKLIANQTVRIVRDRTSVSVNENVRILHLQNGSNWKGRRERR